MRKIRLDLNPTLEWLGMNNQGGPANEVIRALYGKTRPKQVPVILLCVDSQAHFEFAGTRRIFRLPRATFDVLLRTAGHGTLDV